MLFLSTSGLQSTSPQAETNWETSPTAYSGGYFVDNFSGDNQSLFTAGTWLGDPTLETAFTANFGAPITTPEPTSWLLLGTGLLFGALVYRRRRVQDPA